MFELRRGVGGGYFWRLKADDGAILCQSDVYATKALAENSIIVVRSISPEGPYRDLT